MMSAIRQLNELVKTPLLDLTFPALRRLSLPEYCPSWLWQRVFYPHPTPLVLRLTW